MSDDMKAIGKAAQDRAQALLDTAKAGAQQAQAAMQEIVDAAPMLNGVSKAAREAHSAAAELEAKTEKMRQMVRDHFRADPPEESRTAKIREAGG